MKKEYELINNTDKNQYEFHIEGYIPKIEYIISENGEIYLTHTEVPIKLEGQGIGTQLVEKALKDIKEKQYKLVPLCPFVATYIKKNPEWKKIVMRGINV